MDAERQLTKHSPDAQDSTRGPRDVIVDAMREAQRALATELERHPGYPDLRHRLGLLFLAEGEQAAAATAFEEALGIHPGYRAAHFGLRLALLWLGRLDPESSVEPPVDPRLTEEEKWRLIDEAYRLEACGKDPSAALQALEPVMAHTYAAAFAARAGEVASVCQHLEAAAKVDPTTARILTEWGMLPWDDARSAEAVGLLRSLLWTPLAAELYAYIARIYARTARRDDALHALGRAYLIHPHAAAYACHRADLALAFGEEEAALELLREAVRVDPEYARARIALGFEYAAQGYQEEAREQFQAALHIVPDYADIRYNLGLLHMGNGCSEEALEQFHTALALNPGYLPARHSMASLLCRLGRNEEGLREYTRILRQGFQSADMLVRMGRAALAEGKLDEALQYLERSSFVNPDYPLGYYYLGKVYKQKGLKRKARSAWRLYLEKTNDWEPLTREADEGPPPEPPPLVD
jgi:tetratricopeptide (TPR) repeat protein